LASIATNELEPPALLCGFGSKRETVDFIAQAVASINFEPPARSCGFGSKHKVNAKDLRNRDIMVDAPSPRPRLLPSMRCRQCHCAVRIIVVCRHRQRSPGM
jgi:hypothetical protein